ncbi:hypothetical protein [Pleomorphovibrio marinus]|uniref:hypothetical protein n=1 Tax=Pleomorphovibrio marinus TaxID=2164132 RepID=UPI001300AE4C|nr:hypothetical protein [Pleomorphovibrio marinus]
MRKQDLIKEGSDISVGPFSRKVSLKAFLLPLTRNDFKVSKSYGGAAPVSSGAAFGVA